MPSAPRTSLVATVVLVMLADVAAVLAAVPDEAFSVPLSSSGAGPRSIGLGPQLGTVVRQRHAPAGGESVDVPLQVAPGSSGPGLQLGATVRQRRNATESDRAVHDRVPRPIAASALLDLQHGVAEKPITQPGPPGELSSLHLFVLCLMVNAIGLALVTVTLHPQVGWCRPRAKKPSASPVGGVGVGGFWAQRPASSVPPV
mmetsp:Transcript_121823/g.351697  ORF Transcript_121823/g.351697 Transcript_121823/m.351697 type:complete len:201 (-) Transcript_121823:131-733(-)